ncbi:MULTISPECIES: hypothetical protein [Streptomyces violaceusniger group]|uniref:hypothetical protein n=1 Tax=Streptomyces violaceusniger group TaxID=2839105 RepID=UPI001ABFB456|nr:MULTISPECIES: hypothetical protein [Streptomyces violaceusniger group]
MIEQQAAAVGAVEVRAAANAVDRLDLAQRLHPTSQAFREPRVRHHPRDLDVAEAVRRP